MKKLFTITASSAVLGAIVYAEPAVASEATAACYEWLAPARSLLFRLWREDCRSKIG